MPLRLASASFEEIFLPTAVGLRRTWTREGLAFLFADTSPLLNYT